jgi:acetylornithine deacetylase/succinyl-diaminopimelate desuccinylase-like protein
LIGFFTEVRREFDALKNRCPDGLSFTIGRIEGGEGINSIPRQATAAFEFRSVDQKLLEILDRDLMRLTERLGTVDGLSIRITPLGWRPAAWPVKPERIEPLALKVLSAIGETSVPVVRSTNINATLDAGWPSLCMGLCRSGRFHSPDEYVELDSVEKGWSVLGGLIEGLAAPRRTGTPSGNPEGAV